MPKEIRLLSIVTRMNVGGPAVQIATLMRGFRNTEVNQVLLTGTVAKDEQDFLDVRGQDLNFRRVPSLMRAIRPHKDARALNAIASYIRRFQPDVIHTHTAKAGTLGRLAAILTRSEAKRVHTFHGHLLNGYFSPAGTRRVIATESYLAQRTDRLIAVGKTVRDDLLRVGIGSFAQYHVVPPGLTLGDLPTRAEARLALGLNREDRVVCFIGRLTPIKRIDRLLRVIETISKIDPDVVFIVAGEGSEAGLLADAVSAGQNVRPLGWRSDVERLLAASDAMVLTSDNEGTPVSLIQAGLAGLPVVSTDVGSVSDVVQHGRSGLLTSTDPDDIANALMRILSDAEFAQSVRDFAVRDYEQRFGSELLVKSHLDVYYEVLGH